MHIENIIVPLDGSAAAERVLNLATGFARGTGTRIHLFTVVKNDGEVEHTRRYLGRLAATLERETDGVVRVGDPATEILTFASTVSGPLILLGTHGAGGEARVLLGRTAGTILAAARIPVMLVDTLQPDSDQQAEGRVVLLTREAAEVAVWYALELATQVGLRPRLERISGPDFPGLSRALLDADLVVLATDQAEGIPPELFRALAAGRLRGRALPVVKLGPAVLSQGRSQEGMSTDGLVVR